jgi:hypothetical protein
MKPHHQPLTHAAGEDRPVGHPASLMLVRVFSDGIEINEQYGESRTADLIRELRRLGVLGEVDFRTPCG